MVTNSTPHGIHANGAEIRSERQISTAYSQNQHAGFTLIELMVVTAVISILAFIAYPSYMNSIRKSHRSDAHTALARIASNQERFFANNGRYTTNPALLGFSLEGDGVDAGFFSDNGHYTMTISPGATGITSSYSISATAASSMQTNDTDACQTFTLNSLGQRTPNPRTSPCW